MPAAPMLAAVAVILEGKNTDGLQIIDFNNINMRLYFILFLNFLPDSDDLTKVHLHVVDLSDEDGCQRLIQSCPVHVDGGAHGQHEACDSLVDFVVFLQTFEGDREGG